MLIKVCGLYDRENIREILSLRPDLIGLNFYPASRRFCRLNELPDCNRDITKLVGVFVNASEQEVLDKVSAFNLSMIQLHGNEAPADFMSVREKHPEVKIIKAFGIEGREDFLNIEEWRSQADFFLFDSKAVSFGGSGRKFNWDLLSPDQIGKSFFLAGGIQSQDARALKQLSKVLPDLYAVDINSRFENMHGLKEPDMVGKFIDEIRS